MQNNKIYTTLANLYNQLKGFVGDTGRSLSEEVDHRIKNNDEVIKARKGHGALIDKVNAIDTSIDDVSCVISDTRARVDRTEESITGINQEINTIKTTVPTVEIENGNHLLVNLSSRPSHKTESFSLDPGAKHKLSMSNEHYVTQLYVRDNFINQEVNMPINVDTSHFDKTINELKDGSLYSISTGEMKMPLSNMLMANELHDDIAFVPGLCYIQGTTTSPYFNEENHVVSAFRSGYEWSLKSRMAEIIIEFVHPIEVTKILFNFSANTNQQSVSICRITGNNWIEIQKVPSSDGRIVVNEKLKSIKLAFISLSDQETTLLKIKNIEIFSKEYGTNSNTVSVTELINSYDLSGNASIAPIIDIPEDTICKFGIASNGDSDECHVLYPSKRHLSAGLFENAYGMHVIDKIKSEIKDSYILDDRYNHKTPTGKESYITIGDTTWNDSRTLTFSNGYKLDDLTYVKLYIKTKTVEHEFTLSQEYLNKITTFVIDDVEVFVEVKSVRNSIKLGVQSESNIAAVRCELNTVRDIYTGTSSNYTSYYCGSYVTNSYDQVSMLYSLSSTYDCYYNSYSYRWTWNGWSWAWRWVHTSTSRSSFNKTRKQSVIFVDCDSMRSNVCTTSSRNLSEYFNTSFELKDVSNVVAYIGIENDALKALETDGTIVPSYNYSRVSVDNIFIGHMKISKKQKIVRLEPDQYADLTNDVEYFISFNNYNFYTYSYETNAWVQSKDGMSMEEVIKIPSYAFEKLFVDEDLYIKIKINNKNAYVNGVNIEFDNEQFETIQVSKIKEYGMNLSDIKSISPSFIIGMASELGTLAIFMQSEPKLGCWQYVVPGMQLIEYGGTSWLVADSSVAVQHTSGSTCIITNVSDEFKYFRLEQKYFEDSVVYVGDEIQNKTLNDVEVRVGELTHESNIAQAKLELAEQSIYLLHSAVEHMSTDSWYDLADEVPNYGESVKFELPTFIIPNRLEVELEPLLPGVSTEINNVDDFGNIQYWDTVKNYVIETIESKATQDLQHQFSYLNGVFAQDYFEIDKSYDTDNSYLMSRSASNETPSSYNTADYSCTSKYQDGTPCSVRGAGLFSIMRYSRDGINGNHSDYASGNLAYFDLPGEDKRFVDIDVDFNESRYIYGLYNMDFNCTGGSGSSSYSWGGPTTLNSNQQTVILLDIYGNGNWVEHYRYTGLGTNVTCYIQKEVKKIRVRLEIPYASNKGAGTVSLKYFDIYYCPVRYKHEENASIKPVLYYNTGTWDRLVSVRSDATVSGTSTDIRYLFETNDKMYSNKQYLGFDGNKLIVKPLDVYSNGMTLYEFNSLSEEQLKPLLGYHYIRPVAILYSSDGLHSPSIKSFELNYSEKSYTTTSLVPSQDVITRYDRKAKKVIVTNATSSTKTLRAIIS